MNLKNMRFNHQKRGEENPQNDGEDKPNYLFL